MTTKAGSTGRGADHSPSPYKCLYKSFSQGIKVYLLRARDNNAPHPQANLPPFQYPGSNLQVFKATIGAATNYGLIDFYITYLANGLSISW